MCTGHRAVRAAVIGLVLALFALALPALPAGIARAAGLMTADPEEANTGEFVSLNGVGFAANQILRIYLSSNAAQPGDDIGGQVTAYKHICDATTNGQGAFSSAATFAVPSALDEGSSRVSVGVGDYYIYAIYQGSNRIQGVGRIYVPGPSAVSPSNARIGDWVVINSTGLHATEQVYVYFSSQKAAIGGTIGGAVTVYNSLGLFATSPQGTLGAGVPLQVPSRLTDGRFQEDVHGGTYYVYITYYLSRFTISSLARFVVLDGKISADPTSGTVGSEISITGEGLRPDQQITVRFDGELAPISSGDTKTNTEGRFAAKVLVPDATVGGHRLSVSDITGNHPETDYFVKPNLTAAPANPKVKQTIELHGTGFGDRTEVAVTVNGVTITTDPPLLTTNHDGSFTCGIMAPPAVGSATIIAKDKLDNKAEAKVTIEPMSASTATMTVTPSTSRTAPAYIGMKVSVEGAHFLPSHPITITYAGQSVATATSDASGTFSASFSVPAAAAGTNELTASDGTNVTSAAFVLDNQAPAPPVPTPGVAFIQDGKDVSGFAWQATDDPSGVTYTLQVAANAAFAGPVLEKKGLATSYYTLSAAEQSLLSTEGTYYWRVRATDGVANDGAWTAGIAFDVAPAASGMPVWLWFVIGGAAVVLLAVAGVWLMSSRPRA